MPTERRASAQGRVIEIGFGTGLNLAHYPEQVAHLTVIDQERMLPGRVAHRISLARMPVEQMQLDASGRLPFDDQSFDAAVSTWTLCSIANLGAALQGGLGMAASGNIHPGQVSMFEPVHGSAPKYAGKNVANPFGAILTVGMMLDYIGFGEAAAAVENAVIACVKANETTGDIGGALGTTEVGTAVLRRLES